MAPLHYLFGKRDEFLGRRWSDGSSESGERDGESGGRRSVERDVVVAASQILHEGGDLAKAEPKRLRYRLLHTAARLTRGQRRRWLRIPATWPWAEQITAAFTRIAAIPAPG